jgi:lysophospholipid acyltransferase (LPLAT)-like uncharacterized protein
MTRSSKQNFLAGLKYRLAPSVGYYLINILVRTIFMKRLDESGIDWRNAKPCLLVCWHSDLLFIPVGFRPVSQNLLSNPVVAIASRHGDGRIVAQILEKFGIDGISGSSSDGGPAALMKMRSFLHKGFHVAVSPDGPRGPATVPKPGVVYLASTCNAQIIPFTITCSSQWTLKTWDNFFIPKPFSRTVSLIGTPIDVPPNLKKKELQHYNDILKERLDTLKEKAKDALIHTK